MRQLPHAELTDAVCCAGKASFATLACTFTLLHAVEVERKILGLLAGSARMSTARQAHYRPFALQSPALQWAQEQQDPRLRLALF